MGLLLALALAHAGEPVVERGDDSRIRGHVDLDAPPAAVFAVVSDPVLLSSFDEVTRVEVRPDGACVAIRTFVDHPLAKTTYETRSCADGPLARKQTLVSGDMSSFESRWWVAPREGGSRLNYEIRAVPRMPVPQYFVDRATENGARSLLEAIAAHLAKTAG